MMSIFTDVRRGLLSIGYRSYGSLTDPIKLDGFLTSSSCVNTTQWMHHMNTDRTQREKAGWYLRKNATSYSEQIKVAKPHEVTAERPLTPLKLSK